MSILITTYEGTHSHPLPIAATAMASTTSAAASMLLSGSSSSRPGLVPSAATTSTAANQLHGLNFYLSENSKPNQFYFPNTSISSSPASYPTITLDLTSSSSSSASSSSSPSFSSHFNRLPSAYPPAPRFSSLNFSSLESNTLPISWSNGQLTYGNTTQTYNKNTNNIASIHLGARQPPQENNFYQSFMQKNSHPTNISQQSLVPDTTQSTIAAATKAITSDPNFQSALAAALTSIIGANHGSLNQGGLVENLGHKLKWGDQFLPPVSSNTYQPTSKGNGTGCGSSYLNNRPTSSSNPQPAAMFLPPSSLPFSSSKSASTSPGDESRDHTN